MIYWRTHQHKSYVSCVSAILHRKINQVALPEFEGIFLILAYGVTPSWSVSRFFRELCPENDSGCHQKRSRSLGNGLMSLYMQELLSILFTLTRLCEARTLGVLGKFF